MPQKVIKFTGINRKANEYQNSGACEELVNLRPEVGYGHRVIRQKKIIDDNVSCLKIYEHSFGDISNSIIVNLNGSVSWKGKDGVGGLVTNDFIGKSVEVSSAGNVLIVYSREAGKQNVYKFEEGEYSVYELIFREVLGVAINYNAASIVSYTVSVEGDSIGAYRSALFKAASAFYGENPNGLCGVAVVAMTYELEDGSEVWTTAYTVANAAHAEECPIPEINMDKKTVTVYGLSKVQYTASLGSEGKSNVKKFNVYATRPVFPYDVDQSLDSYSIKDVSLYDLGLDGQLMYYQGSPSIKSNGFNQELNFSVNQSSERVLKVDAGCIERLGDIVSYNSRFHYYKSDVIHVIQPVNVFPNETFGDPWITYVKFDKKWRLVHSFAYFYDTSKIGVIYPMAGVTQIAFVRAYNDSQGYIKTSYEDMFYVDMKDSSSYNYSYAFSVTPSIVSAETFHETVRKEGQLYGGGYDKKVSIRKETNVINVSAQYNPFVFPIEYSYNFSGEIADVATSYVPISSTQVGQYPLTVFTSNGIFSMEQGDGSVLYSNITPLQPIVINGKATTTPYGTFFISSKSVYQLSGRDLVNISDVLKGKREVNLRNLESYKRLCFNENEPLYDFSSAVSSKDFEEFVTDCCLTYDQSRNELYIGGTANGSRYSYVFNLNTNMFHKIGKVYMPSPNGARYVIEITGETRNVVDLFTEEDSTQPIFLQSRPISLEVLYTHISRLLLNVDAHLSGDEYLCLSVFGSDNLYDWKCIISSQKRNAILRHMRTNRAAKSYKDYIILINGVVHSDTDISDIITDYTVVNRRLG